MFAVVLIASNTIGAVPLLIAMYIKSGSILQYYLK